MPVPTPVMGKKKTPIPARITVLPPKAAGVQATPNRGPTLSAGVSNRLRFPEVGNSRPPLTTNCDAGNSGSGFLAYAARAAALMGLGELKSKPFTDRL